MLILNPNHRAGGYPPSSQFPAFYKDRKVNAPGSLLGDARQSMMEKRGGSTALLAQRAGDSMQTAMRGDGARPEASLEPAALNQVQAIQPAPQQLALNPAQHYRLDAPDDAQLVPYNAGGGPPPPDPDATAVEPYGLFAPIRNFASRQYNSLMEQLPQRPRNVREHWLSIPVPHAAEDDAQLALGNGQQLALGNGQAALPPPLIQGSSPLAIEAGQAALPAGQPALGTVRAQAVSPPPIMNREVVPMAAPPPRATGSTRPALAEPPPVRPIRDYGPPMAAAASDESPMIVQLREPEKVPTGPVSVMPSFARWLPGGEPKAIMPAERGRSPPPDHVANLTRMAGNVLGAGLRGAAKGISDYAAPAAYEVSKYAATKALEGGSAAIQNHLIPGMAGGSDWAYRALTSANAHSTRYMLDKLNDALDALVDENRDNYFHEAPALMAKGRVVSPPPGKRRNRSMAALPAPEPSVDSRNFKGHRDRSPQGYAGAVPQTARHAEVMKRSEESLRSELEKRPEVAEVVKQFPGVSARDWLGKLDKKKLAMMAVRLNL